MRIRPIREEDLAALERFAGEAGCGLTTLPADSKRLREKIDCSLGSFSGELGREDAHYTFILETPEGEVVGTSTVAASVGMREPWYNFRLGTAVHASQELGLYQRHRTLVLCNDLTDSTELCTLFLLPRWRRSGNGTLLSRIRFLFLAEFPHLFQPRTIAEMRGRLDEQGKSPFWEGLGRHFFRMEFQQADTLVGIGHKAFIAEMLPRHTVYVDLLPRSTRNAIGEVHMETESALRILEGEGFSQRGYVDIFDGGPVVECDTASIHSVRESAVLSVSPSDDLPVDAECYLVCTRGLGGFRACLCDTVREGEVLPLSPRAMATLEIEAGASVRAVRLKAGKGTAKA
jgi:arginine N-succinyltransferase